VAKLITLLSVLLAAQIGVVAWVNRSSGDLATFNAAKPLLDVDAGEVDEVVIKGEGKEPLVMKRKEGKWVLPGQAGFPVSSKKLDVFLKKLLTAKPSWPVGRTEVAAKQLKVTEDSFERKISLLKNGEVLGEVYLGTSPGFRKVHARLVGTPDTYAIDFNTFDAPMNPADWYDRDLLRVAEADIERIDMGAFALTRGEKGFELEGLAPDEQTNPGKAEEVVGDVTSLSFTDVMGKKGKDTFEQGQLILEFTVKGKDGKAVKYTVVAPSGQANYYILKSSNYPYYLKVAKKKFDDLRALDRAQLVQAKAKVGGQKSEVGNQTSGEAGQRSEVGGQKAEIGN
jgi:hypothetical protein